MNKETTVRMRELRPSDFQEINRIWVDCGHSERFGLPSLANVVTTAVVEKDGQIIGFGVVKAYAEGISILDLSKSKADRLEALEKLLSEAFRACQECRIEHMHVFVQDESMQRLLENKFGFKVATGVALVKEF